MKHLTPPYDPGLGEPKHSFEDTFSAFTVIKETFFPHLLNDKEKQQIAERDA